MDGSRSYSGGWSCVETTEAYRERIEARLAETGGMSPVEIGGNAYLAPGATLAVRSTFALLDPTPLIDLQATFFVVEETVELAGTWPRVVREVRNQPIVLGAPGDSVVVDLDIPINPAWNWENLYVVAFLQQTSGSRPIIQGRKLLGPQFAEFSSAFGSVPDGNGAEVFDGLVRNDTPETRTYRVEEAVPFGDWAVAIQVGHDPEWRALPVEIGLDPRESVPVRLRVTTNDAIEIRAGTIRVVSQAVGLAQDCTLRVFNGSWSILYVDDDNHRPDGLAIEQAMDAGGLLHDTWDAAVAGTPSAGDMDPYDAVLWQTGVPVSTGLADAGALDAVKEYIDRGGRLLLTSQGYLHHGAIDPDFTATYLGVASSLLDQGYTELRGVAGDPIGDGLELSIDAPAYQNRPDFAFPASTATVFLQTPGMQPAALRNEAQGDRRTVFLPWMLQGLEPAAMATVIHRSLEWMQPRSPASSGATGFPPTTRIDGAQPNPFRGSIAIRFTVEAGASREPLRLEVFDLEGRKLAVLFEGILVPGEHTRSWDGGTEVAGVARSGVYFARLVSRSGASSLKLIRMD